MLGGEIKGSVYAETMSWSVSQASALLEIDNFNEAFYEIKIINSDQLHFLIGVSVINSEISISIKNKQKNFTSPFWSKIPKNKTLQGLTNGKTNIRLYKTL